MPDSPDHQYRRAQDETSKAGARETGSSGAPVVPTDRDGYLRRLDDWDEEVAAWLAGREGIELTDDHWEIIRLLRRFYQQHQLAPANRPLVKLVARELGKEKGNSIYLMRLFTGKPALIASKIAGLPRPENCF